MDAHHHFAVGHVGLNVTDLARSKQSYQHLFGAANQKTIRPMDCDIVTPQLFRSIRWARRYHRPIDRTVLMHETDFCPA